MNNNVATFTLLSITANTHHKRNGVTCYVLLSKINIEINMLAILQKAK